MKKKLCLHTKKRCNNRHKASSCPDLQHRLVHKVELFTVGIQVLTESQSLKIESVLEIRAPEASSGKDDIESGSVCTNK